MRLHFITHFWDCLVARCIGAWTRCDIGGTAVYGLLCMVDTGLLIINTTVKWFLNFDHLGSYPLSTIFTTTSRNMYLNRESNDIPRRFHTPLEQYCYPNFLALWLSTSTFTRCENMSHCVRPHNTCRPPKNRTTISSYAWAPDMHIVDVCA